MASISERVKDTFHSLTRGLGFEVHRRGTSPGFPDLPSSYIEVYRAVGRYTMTPEARIYALLDAIHYLTDSKIPGSFAECGVWRGGSAMAAIKGFMSHGVTDRDVFLYDTFEGMAEPTTEDGKVAAAGYDAHRRDDGGSDWIRAEIDDVRSSVLGCGYPEERIHFVKGKVEETIPEKAPEKISLLRIDTDWYESTKHNLEHLYPRVSPGGVVILDDYGSWEGARKAIDEYVATLEHRPFIHRIDQSARVFVKRSS